MTFVLSLPFSSFHLLALLLFLFLSSCARQGYPTGGPRDIIPPLPLDTRPRNESRHFKADEFYIQFNEYVVLKNAEHNVLVSPPMKHKPEFTTKGKGILVKINDTLQENTTYLFQFKEAVADFTEGNLLPSFEYVFSTGADMDTFMLGGRVLDPLGGKPWKETVTVMAYRVDSTAPEGLSATGDTMACSLQPDLVTRCDKEGFFAFHYIPAGSYRLVALEDKNRDLRVGVDEAVAWDTVPTASADSIDSAHVAMLSISRPAQRLQRITKSEFVERGRIVVTTQLPMTHPTVSGEEVEWRLNARRDTLTLWCLNARCDSTVLVVSDEGLQDTLKLRFTEKRKGTRRLAGTREEKTPLVKALCSGNNAYYDDLRLAFSNPVVKMADSALAEVMLLKDSTVTRCPLSVDSSGLTARLEIALKSGEQYSVRLRDSLFTDLYGNVSDSLVFTLTPKDYGILSLAVTNATGSPLVVEVLDDKDTVVQSKTLDAIRSTLRFTHLPAGNYRLRAIVDRNGDGHWTPGDYRRQQLPETALLFDKTLNLREKWEMEEQWKVENKSPVDKIDLKAFQPGKNIESGMPTLPRLNVKH